MGLREALILKRRRPTGPPQNLIIFTRQRPENLQGLPGWPEIVHFHLRKHNAEIKGGRSQTCNKKGHPMVWLQKCRQLHTFEGGRQMA